MEALKKYNKHYLKRNPATGEIIKGNKPILGELAKAGCPLDERNVRILNRGWQNTGVYFVEVIPDVDEVIEIPDKATIKEPKKLLKKDLVSDCEDKGLDTSGNIKELTERLANHEG